MGQTATLLLVRATGGTDVNCTKLSSLSSFDVKGLRLPGAGGRDPSRRDGKVGEVDVNRPVMVVEFYECNAEISSQAGAVRLP